MEHPINSLIGYSLEATDGEIGEVTDFYFDDETWTIRYLVVKTGGWLSGRKVLISPTALLHNGFGPGLIPVKLTREQVRTSPDIDTDKPVSRQKEAMLNKHHFWENYWGSGSYGGQMGIANARPVRLSDSERDPNEDIHLRAITEVDGYEIHALDGVIGHVSDLIVDDQNWRLTNIVVDTHDWIGGHKVLIPVEQIQAVSFFNLRVSLNIQKADIEHSKPFDADAYSDV
jgi:sporulation protein YlmC with PRC-barrel domain